MLVAATCSVPPSSLEVTGEVTGRVWLHLDPASMDQSEGESLATAGFTHQRLLLPASSVGIIFSTGEKPNS